MKAFPFLTLIFFAFKAYSQNWNLVWSDEFTSTISPDWSFEIGRGNSGWGNNEYQYYQQENATIEDGKLIITAKKESVHGANYTSARLKTQGLKYWKYGKVEASISIPSFTGSWPAFWMLGENITTVSWPACGEIDIMEHINTSDQIHGTMHWQDHNGQYANYGIGQSFDFSGFHTYSIEWDEQYIKWFFDGQQYHIASIENGINGTSEFHNHFFILLNMAIGGNWPGFVIDDTKLPAQMKIDYVRVYQKESVTSTQDQLKNTVQLFPNPASIHITLITENAANYRISDLTGTTVQSSVIVQNRSIIDLNTLSSGIYFFSIFDDKNHLIKSERIVIQ